MWRVLEDLLGGRDAKLVLDLDKDELSRPDMVIWAKSRERDWYLKQRPRVYLFAIVGGLALLMAAILAQPGKRADIEIWWAAFLATFGCVVLVYCTFSELGRPPRVRGTQPYDGAISCGPRALQDRPARQR